MDYKVKIGKKLIKLRKKAGFGSSVDFAVYHDLSKNTIYRIECGKDFKFSSLEKILEIHGMSLKEFFKDFK